MMPCRTAMFAAAVAIASIGTGRPACAQSSTSTPQPVSTAIPTTVQTGVVALTNPYQRFDDLSLKGWDVPFPRIGDTLTRNAYGVRGDLADAGFGFFGLVTANSIYNVLQNAHPSSPITYNGQKFIVNAGVMELILTYDLGHIGIDHGQIILSTETSFNGLQRLNGPDASRVENVAYFQSLLNDTFELKIGLIDNAQEYLGTFVGGNIATGTLGPLSNIPYQVGLTYEGATPAVNLRWNGPEHYYIKVGAERSYPEGGFAAEEKVNRDGFRFAPPNTGLLAIDEFGYNQPSGPGQRSFWLRTGSLYNNTNYTDFNTGRQVGENYALFLAVDRQLTQRSRELPFDGVFAGFTVNLAPAQQNLFKQYYELRLYGVGLFAHRPFDLASLVLSDSQYSGAARLALSRGQPSYQQTNAGIASYAYRLIPGLYVQPGIGVTEHPTFTPKYASAFNLYLGLTTLF